MSPSSFLMQSPLRVIVVGGWSPGPLPLLERRLPEVEFEHVGCLPMPPCGCAWLANPFLALLIFYVAWVAPTLGEMARGVANPGGATLIVLLVVLSFALAGALVAAIVRFSVWHGALLTRRAIGHGAPPALVIGFSWGGGVVHAMLAARSWPGPALLLAPTISAISSIEMRSAWPVIAPDEAERTEVVMPMFDAFCPPSQVEDYRAAGVTVHVVRDDHVMCSRDAVDTIAARVLALARQADDADEG